MQTEKAKKSWDEMKTEANVIHKDFAEKRREELNLANKDNERLKLGISKGAYKKYKVFKESYAKKIEQVVTDFYVDLAAGSITLQDDAVVVYFDKWDKHWRDWARPRVSKLGLHTDDGRREVINKFTDFVGQQINETGKSIKKTKLQEFAEHPVTMDLLEMGITYGIKSEEYATLEDTLDLEVLIANIKKLVPRGKKMAFEAEAKTRCKLDV